LGAIGNRCLARMLLGTKHNRCLRVTLEFWLNKHPWERLPIGLLDGANTLGTGCH